MDVVGLRMKDFQDMYEVTDNLGQPHLHEEYLTVNERYIQYCKGTDFTKDQCLVPFNDSEQ